MLIAGLFLVPLLGKSDPFRARDPGVLPGAVESLPLNGITALQAQLFRLGAAEFAESEIVADGLGPRMNLDNCAGCHSQPATGGSSPARNPQIGLARLSASGRPMPLPVFVGADGPVRVARFLRKADGSPDGRVRPVFSIAYRPDNAGCTLDPVDFETAIATHNIAFRIPTPLFGAGLIEQIPDQEILANALRSNATFQTLGVHGHPARLAPVDLEGSEGGGDTHVLGRFGWKAQNSTLLKASAEAYVEEMGITNELYPNEIAADARCPYVTTAEDGDDAGLPPIDVVRRYRNTLGHRYPITVVDLRARLTGFAVRHPNGLAAIDGLNDPMLVERAASIEKFAFFLRFLAPLPASSNVPGNHESVARGRADFEGVGCIACHTPSMRTRSASDAALRDREVALYSDLLLHDMGAGLADNIAQADAGGREFRTAPLWGLGKRLYLLHDGRVTDLREAIEAHASRDAKTGDTSEANSVVANFDALSEADKQDLFDFLRSL